MKRRAVVWGALVLAAATCAGAWAAEPQGDFSLLLGEKALSGDWKEPSLGIDLSRQPEVGVSFSWSGRGWPVALAADLLASRDTSTAMGVKLEGSTVELDLGVRKYWQRGNARPFVGGGVAVVRGEIKASAFGFSASSDDTGVGGWLDAGVLWRLGSRIDLGFEGRYSQARIRPESSGPTSDVEAGGWHLGLVVGYAWGK